MNAGGKRKLNGRTVTLIQSATWLAPDDVSAEADVQWDIRRL